MDFSEFCKLLWSYKPKELGTPEQIRNATLDSLNGIVRDTDEVGFWQKSYCPAFFYERQNKFRVMVFETEDDAEEGMRELFEFLLILSGFFSSTGRTNVIGAVWNLR
jgi:hypothetical protein